MQSQFRFRVSFYYFGYSHHFASLEAAKAEVERARMEAKIYDGERHLATWSAFGGWKR